MKTTTAQKIEQAANSCADEHMLQGWSGDGTAYALDNFSFDAAALKERLGREPKKAERVEFERQIRAVLTARA